MTHTPGPWTIGAANEFFDAHTSIDAPKWGGFCQVVTKMDMKSDSEEGKANACLIAAAPDLLKALLEMCELTHAPTENALAAIAKATGKAA